VPEWDSSPLNGCVWRADYPDAHVFGPHRMEMKRRKRKNIASFSMLQVYKLPRPETQTVRMQHVAPPTQCTRGLDPHGRSLQVQNIKHKGDISSTIQETTVTIAYIGTPIRWSCLRGSWVDNVVTRYSIVYCDPPTNKRRGYGYASKQMETDLLFLEEFKVGSPGDCQQIRWHKGVIPMSRQIPRIRHTFIDECSHLQIYLRRRHKDFVNWGRV